MSQLEITHGQLVGGFGTNLSVRQPLLQPVHLFRWRLLQLRTWGSRLEAPKQVQGDEVMRNMAHRS